MQIPTFRGGHCNVNNSFMEWLWRVQLDLDMDGWTLLYDFKQMIS